MVGLDQGSVLWPRGSQTVLGEASEHPPCLGAEKVDVRIDLRLWLEVWLLGWEVHRCKNMIQVPPGVRLDVYFVQIDQLIARLETGLNERRLVDVERVLLLLVILVLILGHLFDWLTSLVSHGLGAHDMVDPLKLVSALASFHFGHRDGGVVEIWIRLLLPGGLRSLLWVLIIARSLLRDRHDGTLSALKIVETALLLVVVADIGSRMRLRLLVRVSKLTGREPLNVVWA